MGRRNPTQTRKEYFTKVINLSYELEFEAEYYQVGEHLNKSTTTHTYLHVSFQMLLNSH